jgi:hypothetical protein
MQAQVLNTLPSNATTVTNFYKQNVYDHADAKIGERSMQRFLYVRSPTSKPRH